MRRTPVLILGGGPAGAAAAIMLGRAGHRLEVIERMAGERDVVCGGFLGWDALAALRRLGLDPEALGTRDIHRLRLVAGSRTVETALPHPAAGLSRRRLDAALLETAEAAGATLRRGRAIRSVEAGSRTVRLDEGEEIAADALFLATGKHELRGLARPVPKRRSPAAAGLRAALPPSPSRSRSLEGVIELHLFDQAYAGLLLQEDGCTNLCISVAPARLSEAGGIPQLLDELLRASPLLRQRLEDVPTEEWEAIAGVPYGWRAEATVPGIFRIGDQAAVIASLAGDGIAIALTSGMMAAKAYAAGGPAAAPDWQNRFASRSRIPLAAGELFRSAAERGAPRSALMRLLAFAPGLARAAARLTRIG
jgi:menaquinone-9 beta-reductase